MFKDQPIQRKLVTVILLTSSAVLLLACGTFVVYELLTFRRTMVRNLSTVAQVVATNSTAALAFVNRTDATEVLSALSAEPHIVAAALYDGNGALFARYPASAPDAALPARLEQEGHQFARAHLVLQKPVIHADRRLGTLVLKSDLRAMYERLVLYGSLTVLAIVLSALATIPLSSRLQRHVSRPVLALADAARAVSEGKDYSVRATKFGDDELGRLADAFNDMLAQIQGRDAALRQREEELRREVNERQLAEESVRENQERLGLALEAAQIGHWELDLVTGDARRSPRHDEIFGYSELLPEWTYEVFLQHVHPDDRAMVDASFQAGVAAGDWDFECRILRADQAERWIWARGHVFKNSLQQHVRMLGLVADITERKEAEEAVRASQERFTKAFQLSPDAITISRISDGRIVEANEAWLSLVGLRIDQVIGRTALELDILPRPADRDVVVSRLKTDGFIRDFETLIRLTSGEERQVMLTATRIELDGDPCLMSVVRDVTERKKADAARAHLAAVVESSADAIISRTLDGIIQTWNVGATRIFGYSASEAVGQHVSLLTSPGQEDEEALLAARLQRGETTSNYETQRRRKDGTLIEVSLTVSPIRDDRGQVVGASKIVRDITVRRRLHQRLQLLLEAVPVGIAFSDDPACQNVSGNPTLLAQFEVSRTDNVSASAPDPGAAGRRVRYFQNGREITDAELPLQRAAATNEVIPPVDLEVELPSGRRWFAQVSGAPLRDPQGQSIGGVGIVVDITKRKLAEEEILRLNADLERRVQERTAELRESEARYRALFESIDEGYCILEMMFDEQGTPVDYRFLETNPAFDKQTGVPEAVGRRMREIAPELEDVWFETFGRIAVEGGAGRFQSYAKQLGRWFDVYAYRFGEAKNRQVATVFTDITARKEAEANIAQLNAELQRRAAELEQANKELESFSYSVSHDLRAPLRHVHGYAEMLQEVTGGQLSDKAQRYLNTITEATVEMGQLIDDLLAFSRVGRTEMREDRVRLDELVQETIRGLELATNGRNIIWQTPPLPTVIGDRSLLKQVVANLVGNAVKYSRGRDPARIEIGSAGEEDGRIIFFVRDNGAGFDMRYAHKLFNVFQRLHRAEDFEGTGIGLASVRRIVGRHGGRVWAEAALDEGATFFFTLKPSPGARHERRTA